MKIVSVVGARPQFVKAAVLSRALRTSDLTEVMIHTGQHYDRLMSDIFFEELEIPAPQHNLAMGGGPHGQMSGRMLEGIERILLDEAPDAIVVYGDTNSTLAGALAAAKLHIPVVHVEAGLRSFNRRMPEEINRIVTDHVSTLLFCPTSHSRNLLAQEGITRGVHVIGDLMRAAVDHATKKGVGKSLPDLKTGAGTHYGVFTCHRAENTDERGRFKGILEGISVAGLPVIWPIHPRAERMLHEHGLEQDVANMKNVHRIPPLGYFEMINLLRGASVILSDSGGMQKEAYWLKVPCVTLREETEWVETVECGWNRLAGQDPNRIAVALSTPFPETMDPDIYGGTDAAEQAVKILRDMLNQC